MIVIPAKAGTQRPFWAPAFAGVTRRLLLLLALVTLAMPVGAQTFPANDGAPVVDQAGILTPAQVADLQAKAQGLYTQTGRAFAVATVKSLEGNDVDDYAYRLGRYWKLGSAKNDDGVLLLVAPNERKVAIATGYGAGAYMTDALSGIIIRENILPHFKQNPPDYGGGIEAGADSIVNQMTATADVQQRNVAAADQAKKQRQRSDGNFLPVIFWFFVIGFIILSHFRRATGRRYRRRGGGGINPWVVLWGLNELNRGSRSSGWGGGSGWGDGGGGGGFGGFGGGSFGGGGASGSW